MLGSGESEASLGRTNAFTTSSGQQVKAYTAKKLILGISMLLKGLTEGQMNLKTRSYLLAFGFYVTLKTRVAFIMKVKKMCWSKFFHHNCQVLDGRYTNKSCVRICSLILTWQKASLEAFKKTSYEVQSAQCDSPVRCVAWQLMCLLFFVAPPSSTWVTGASAAIKMKEPVRVQVSSSQMGSVGIWKSRRARVRARQAQLHISIPGQLKNKK